MSTDAIQGLAQHDEVAPPIAPRMDPDPLTGPSFAQRMSDGLREVNQQLLTTQVDLQKLAVGEPVPLHELMIRLEESRISLQLMLQVRNRVLEAYQDMLRMQV